MCTRCPCPGGAVCTDSVDDALAFLSLLEEARCKGPGRVGAPAAPTSMPGTAAQAPSLAPPCEDTEEEGESVPQAAAWAAAVTGAGVCAGFSYQSRINSKHKRKQ
jgi:hypothetical protein